MRSEGTHVEPVSAIQMGDIRICITRLPLRMLAPKSTCPVIHRRQNADTTGRGGGKGRRGGEQEKEGRKRREKYLFHLRWRREIV